MATSTSLSHSLFNVPIQGLLVICHLRGPPFLLDAIADLIQFAVSIKKEITWQRFNLRTFQDFPCNSFGQSDLVKQLTTTHERG